MRPIELIKKLKRENPKAQKRLYDSYAPRFMALCRRYIRDTALAEDVMIEGFMKIFKEIKNYRNIGNFEAWMHRIMVNQCLMELRKNHNLTMHLDPDRSLAYTSFNALDGLYEEDLKALISELPVGCRTVFNLYIIEGYSHREISKQLEISEGTSKSQLHLAKKKLQESIQTTYKNTQHGR